MSAKKKKVEKKSEHTRICDMVAYEITERFVDRDGEVKITARPIGGDVREVVEKYKRNPQGDVVQVIDGKPVAILPKTDVFFTTEPL